jgi:hypothetical protein
MAFTIHGISRDVHFQYILPAENSATKIAFAPYISYNQHPPLCMTRLVPLGTDLSSLPRSEVIQSLTYIQAILHHRDF